MVGPLPLTSAGHTSVQLLVFTVHGSTLISATSWIMLIASEKCATSLKLSASTKESFGLTASVSFAVVKQFVFEVAPKATPFRSFTPVVTSKQYFVLAARAAFGERCTLFSNAS